MELSENRDGGSVNHTGQSEYSDVATCRAHGASRPYLQSALNAAATRTYRLAARFGLSSAEREDLQQDLILDLLEHEHAFDPAKASANTFTGVISQHRAVELLDRLIKDRMRLHFCGRAGEAANDPHLDDPDPDACGAAVMPLWADDPDLFADSDTLHDLNTALACMNGDQRALFDLLEKTQNLAEACEASELSTATFYRRVCEMRMHLRMFGLRSAA